MKKFFFGAVVALLISMPAHAATIPLCTGAADQPYAAAGDMIKAEAKGNGLDIEVVKDTGGTWGIAVKYWKDKSTLQFIGMKRPEEFLGKSREMVIALRETGGYFESFLWSSNNSVAVDQEFWDAVEFVRSGRPNATPAWRLLRHR
ncbi:hypothetical protein [Rhizobium ruizarguesonis]